MLRVVAVVSLCVVMLFPPLTNTVFFRWGTVTLPFPSYRFYCRPSRPPKLCSRLHKYTMFRNVCQVADYINVHVSERLSNGHVQSRGDPGMVFTIRNIFMKPASAVLREREGAFIMATNMTNSEAMVTSAALYTTYGCPRHQNILVNDLRSEQVWPSNVSICCGLQE